MTGFALMVAVVFMTGQGQTFVAKYPTAEICQVELAAIYAKLAAHNQNAAPPDYIVFYSAACAEIKNAPKGKDA